MTSDGDGGPRRTGRRISWFGRSRWRGRSFGRALAPFAKKRRSAISASSPTTKPSVVQPRRVKVQRQMLDASKPISKAMSSPTSNCALADTRKKAKRDADQPVADDINEKASHSRCTSSHSGASTNAQT